MHSVLGNIRIFLNHYTTSRKGVKKLNGFSYRVINILRLYYVAITFLEYVLRSVVYRTKVQCWIAKISRRGSLVTTYHPQ